MSDQDLDLADLTDDRAIGLAEPAGAEADAGIAVSERPEGLTAIRDPRCGAVIWRRDPPSPFQAWIDGIQPACLPEGRMTLRPASVRAAVRALCERYGTPDDAMRDWFIFDIAALATTLADLMNVPFVKLRLDVVTSDMCRKFHVDALTARLICTYRGPGTQCGALTKGDTPSRILSVPTGSPIVLRGTLWPQFPSASIVHRSPPIAGSGQTRLVLVLDPASEPE